jgi:hypothetical protein
MPEQEYRRARGVLLDRTIPVVQPGKHPDEVLLRALSRVEDAPKSWSHAQVAVPKGKLDVNALGFEKTRMAIPLPHEGWFSHSYRKGNLHAHEAGPFYLVHKDAVSPEDSSIGHVLSDVPRAIVQRLSGVEPHVKELAKVAADACYDELQKLLPPELLEKVSKVDLEAVAKEMVRKPPTRDEIYKALAATTKTRIVVKPTPNIGYFAPEGTEELKKRHIRVSEIDPEVLAHELGHELQHEDLIGRLGHSGLSRAALNLGPSAAALGGLLLPNEYKLPALGAALLMQAPSVISEATASMKGDKLLHDAGMSKEDISKYRSRMAKYFLTYAAYPVLTSGAGLLTHYGLSSLKLYKE